MAIRDFLTNLLQTIQQKYNVFGESMDIERKSEENDDVRTDLPLLTVGNKGSEYLFQDHISLLLLATVEHLVYFVSFHWRDDWWTETKNRNEWFAF